MKRIVLAASLVIGCGGHPDAGVDGVGPDGGTGADAAPNPATYPRLVVAGPSGVQIWDNADTIAADRAADATLGGFAGSGLGLAVGHDVLYVTSSDATDAVYRYTGASTLVDGATPAGTIAASGFGGALGELHTKLQADAAGDLWIATAGSIYLVAGAETATAPAAHFTHPWGQIAGMVYDEAGAKLLGGQISGAGLLVWNGAAARTGEVTAADDTLDATVMFNGDIADGRLYTSHFSPADVPIWSGISALSAPTAPDATAAALCGPGELRYTTVTRDVLIAVHNELIDNGTGQLEKICLFVGAAALTGTRAPDAVAMDASLHQSGGYQDKAVLTADGHLFVLDRDGVAIFKDALTTPAFVTRLTTGAAQDMIVLE